MPNPNITEFRNDESIMMSTNLQLSEGLRPRRVVLRELDKKFVTHYELMRIDIETRVQNGSTYDVIVCSHEAFDQGHYFEYGQYTGRDRSEALKAARSDFENRRR